MCLFFLGGVYIALYRLHGWEVWKSPRTSGSNAEATGAMWVQSGTRSDKTSQTKKIWPPTKFDLVKGSGGALGSSWDAFGSKLRKTTKKTICDVPFWLHFWYTSRLFWCLFMVWVLNFPPTSFWLQRHPSISKSFGCYLQHNLNRSEKMKRELSWPQTQTVMPHTEYLASPWLDMILWKHHINHRDSHAYENENCGMLSPKTPWSARGLNHEEQTMLMCIVFHWTPHEVMRSSPLD